MIKAEVVADSISTAGVRLTTFVLKYPRFIHSELMTHRVFSRNASSSRAIPVKKSIQLVQSEPVIPLAFTRNQKGMQGGEALSGSEHDEAVSLWLKGRDYAVEIAQGLSDLEVHKQYANRVLEPYSWIQVVLTSTDFSNWYALRYHGQAQPEIHVLAKLMFEAQEASTPKFINPGEWHLPFIDPKTSTDTLSSLGTIKDTYEWSMALVKRSAARCARVSYLNHDGSSTTYEQDLQLHDRLLKSAPLHASPAEHQAMAVGDSNVRSGNFRGWIQYRKTIPNENISHFNPPILEDL